MEARISQYVWHIDGYDKIKPFGIAISGCIDGFSRKMLWLEAHKTNNDPKIIGGYFMDAVIAAGGCPARAKLALGTENGHIAELQRCLHFSENQAQRDTVSFGPSTGNQRIERWWLVLRSECAQF
ncbi:hypothetical protein ATANTOWER_004438 [Ataeniobius toweri]|uniref:Integrase core domain-containing protein n=1 Tax=Ataeniobius toweri TaxID=208326 RepID=A0ABU7AMY8_9TELE|nr:hypothetical protein [Ataeniobius toweri]